jgi:hypothetical protein
VVKKIEPTEPISLAAEPINTNTILDNTQKTILILSLLTSATEEEQMMKETGEAF